MWRNKILSVGLWLVGVLGFSQAPTISGTLEIWGKVVLTYTSAANYSETGSPNPFTDRRLIVTFTGPDTNTYEVYGHFAADGNAANTGATSGNQWRVYFCPDQVGTWSYSTSFRSGTGVANTFPASPTDGSALDFNGETGSFAVGVSTAPAGTLQAKGKVVYNGTRYLVHAGDQSPFLKLGADSPENAFAYGDFDNTTASKTWTPHAGDWQSGDPEWNGTNGRELIGALNYLESVGANAFSFLSMNVNGDGDDVWPWAATVTTAVDDPGTDAAAQMQYDVSKLDQWDIVFDHADSKNMFIHFKTQETENGGLLQGLSDQRKTYYRELISRFGHHLALNWNIGEENVNTDLEVQQFADYFDAIDPYANHITIHTYPDQISKYAGWDGPTYDLTGASMQNPPDWTAATGAGSPGNHERIYTLVYQSAAAGKQWAIANDEQVSADIGVGADAAYSAYNGNGTAGDNRDEIRKYTLWGTFMAGGFGTEYYYGYQTGTTDLNAQDHRSRATKWADGKIAVDFLRTRTLQNTNPDSTIVSGTRAFALENPGIEYLVYLPEGGTATLTTTGSGNYSVQWFDPRNGGSLQNGTVSTIPAGSAQSLGSPPNNTSLDWLAVVENQAANPDPDGGVSAQIGGNPLRAFVGSSSMRMYVQPAETMDADAAAFITQIETGESIPISESDETAIDTFVKALKSNGFWDKFEAIYPFVGSVYDSQKYNLKNPVDSDAAYRMVPFTEGTGTNTHSSMGWQTNASSDTDGAVGYTYFTNDKWCPGGCTNGQDFNFGLFMYGTLDLTGVTRAGLDMSMWNGSGTSVVQSNFNDGYLRIGGNGGAENITTAPPGAVGIGFYGGYTDGLYNKLWWNGSLRATSDILESGDRASNTTSLKGMVIGSLHNGLNPPTTGSHFYGPSHKTGRWGFLALSIDDWNETEVGTLETIVSALMVSFGRN